MWYFRGTNDISTRFQVEDSDIGSFNIVTLYRQPYINLFSWLIISNNSNQLFSFTLSSRYVIDDDNAKLSLTLDDASSINSSNSNLSSTQNQFQKLNSLQQNSKFSPQLQPNSNFKNESNPKIDESRSKPFVLSGQYVKDPQINWNIFYQLLIPMSVSYLFLMLHLVSLVSFFDLL